VELALLHTDNLAQQDAGQSGLYKLATALSAVVLNTSTAVPSLSSQLETHVSTVHLQPNAEARTDL
jgi:hypothetical protein